MRDKITSNHQSSPIKRYLFSIILICLILLSCTSTAVAASIKERVEQFPQWTSKPSIKLARGDLEYPEWMAGTWNVTSILTEQIAPLSPDIVTPGFEDNQDYLDKAIAFQVLVSGSQEPHLQLSSEFGGGKTSYCCL